MHILKARGHMGRIGAMVTPAFLDHQRSHGNDLSTPLSHDRFPGLAPSDRWCDRRQLAAGRVARPRALRPPSLA